MGEKRAPRIVSAHDGTGTTLCRYDDDGGAVLPPRTPRRHARGLLDVFLPAGYPHSVTDDYTPYQIYDSLQAFSSTIAGLMASRAVLEGFRRRHPRRPSSSSSSASTATAAVLLTVLQESAGRLATILFAHRLGTAIEPEAKFYRLLADVLNDAAMVLDLLSPFLASSPYTRALALCASGVLRALCGVAAGSAKASLSAHFASSSSSSSRPRNNNSNGGGAAAAASVAELNAKDGSQETVVSLAGMLAGSLLLRAVRSPAAVAACALLLLPAHLATNAAAVRAVRLRSLNRQRAELVVRAYLLRRPPPGGGGRVLRPDEVAARESILFWRPGPFAPLLARRPPSAAGPGMPLRASDLERHSADPYVVTAAGRPVIYMKEGATARDVLRAYMEVLAAGVVRGAEGRGVEEEETDMKEKTTEKRNGGEHQQCLLDDDFWKALASAGWDLDAAALETGPAVRIRVE